MYKSPVKAALAGTAFLLAVLVLCVGAVFLKGETTAEAAVPAAMSDEEMYRNQGLEPGQALSAVPSEIAETRVTFPDRVLLRCGWTEAEEGEGIRALQTLLRAVDSRCGGQVKTYVMTVPLRIGFEQDFSTDDSYLQVVREERERLEELEGSMISQLEGLAVGLPLIETLDEHRSEYVFFRTDGCWTARGAYYGAQEFLAAAGLEPFPLGSFYETAKGTMKGALVDPLGSIQDRVYVYLYQNYNPLVDQLETGERAPMVSLARGGIGQFIGGGCGVHKFDGLAENGRSLLLMGRGNAAVFAPWMVTQFETIVFVDLDWYSVDDWDFWQLFSQYGVTDLLVIEDTDVVSSSKVTKTFHDLAEQP